MINEAGEDVVALLLTYSSYHTKFKKTVDEAKIALEKWEEAIDSGKYFSIINAKIELECALADCEFSQERLDECLDIIEKNDSYWPYLVKKYSPDFREVNDSKKLEEEVDRFLKEENKPFYDNFNDIYFKIAEKQLDLPKKYDGLLFKISVSGRPVTIEDAEIKKKETLELSYIQ